MCQCNKWSQHQSNLKFYTTIAIQVITNVTPRIFLIFYRYCFLYQWNKNVIRNIIFILPGHHWWAPRHQPLCWYQNWTATASVPVLSPGCTADTDSCLWARWRGTDCGLHPPTPPPPASPHSEPGQISPEVEPEGGTLSSGSAVHVAAAMAEGKSVDSKPILVHAVSSEPAWPQQTQSSPRPVRQNVKKHASTFLGPSVRSPSCAHGKNKTVRHIFAFYV